MRASADRKVLRQVLLALVAEDRDHVLKLRAFRPKASRSDQMCARARADE